MTIILNKVMTETDTRFIFIMNKAATVYYH